jgi:hypothetical protein
VIALERAMPSFLEARHYDLMCRITDQTVLLAAVVEFGDPEPDEPLAKALERAIERGVSQSELDWKQRLYPDLSHREWALKILDDRGERKRWDIGERNWFQGVINSAPAWLLFFARVDWTAEYLELQLPAGVKEQIPGRLAFENRPPWPELPMGAFLEGGQMTPEEYRAALSREAAQDQKADDVPQTRRERRLLRQRVETPEVGQLDLLGERDAERPREEPEVEDEF